MGLAMNIIGTLSLIVGAAYGAELLFDRYATSEARGQVSTAVPQHSGSEAGRDPGAGD